MCEFKGSTSKSLRPQLWKEKRVFFATPQVPAALCLCYALGGE